MSLERLLAQLAGPSELSLKDETYDLALADNLAAPERLSFVAALSAQAREGDTRAILTLGRTKATEAIPLFADGASCARAALKGRMCSPPSRTMPFDRPRRCKVSPRRAPGRSR